jgi:hypothetical protein
VTTPSASNIAYRSASSYSIDRSRSGENFRKKFKDTGNKLFRRGGIHTIQERVRHSKLASLRSLSSKLAPSNCDSRKGTQK